MIVSSTEKMRIVVPPSGGSPMSSSEIHKSRHTEQPAEQTGDFLSDHNTADAAASVDTSKHPPQSDPLLALLRPPQADGELGRLAHFAITRLLGRGGMGAVFAADDLLLHRKVALKVMRPELTMRLEARERFLREARTAGGLDHDHIIAVHAVAEDNGVWFIVMPLLKGEPLDARLAREGRLSMTKSPIRKIGRYCCES
jgi:serine/threonine protein kinase